MSAASMPSSFRRASTRGRLSVSSKHMIPSAMPLMTMPFWNRPSAAGVFIREVTLAPPPDWPKMVTFSGSPPNWAMLSWIHCRDATRSALPTLPEFQYFSTP